MNLQNYNLRGVASENPALEYEHLVQKDESGKWKEEIKTKVGENYMRIILVFIKDIKIKHRSTLLNILKDKPNILN
ncbi:hypothetical protein TNCV_774861 [Trichonephila clavipes]|nr:hypothetical protein TNCV_774861 [Trichonephila clavipes]